MQRREIVEDPEGAALSGENEILVSDLDVGDRRGRQIQLEGLPVCAVIERDVDPELGARIEQTGTVRVFAHYARGLVGSNSIFAVCEPLPRFAEVIGAVDVRREVAEQ